MGKTVKNALLRYDAKNGIDKNIGDYVQSVAAKQFVGDDAILIEREHLHEYAGEPVKLIMAAWWMHYPENWPPSPDINPLFISFHITPDKAEKMLNDKGVAYLKQYEPIGCRDKGTQRLLESKGIKAYFSGCLTLTLGETYKHKPIDDKVVFIDPHFDVPTFRCPSSFIKPLWTLVTKFNMVKKFAWRMYQSYSLKSLIKAAIFYRIYAKKFSLNLLLNADYYSHSVYEPQFKDEREKFDYTDTLLKAYSQAKFVVTSRLHASLPTIAMGVPTIFIQSEKIPRSPGRFEGLLEHVNCIEYKNNKWQGVNGFDIAGEIDCNTNFVNKDTHIDISNNLISACKEFINADNVKNT